MAEEEVNFYLQDLESARTTVDQQITGLLGDHATLQTTIVQQIGTNDGWVCPEADTWLVDLAGECNPVKTAFDDALEDLDAEITAQSRTPMVPAGNWRGLAWRNSH